MGRSAKDVSTVADGNTLERRLREAAVLLLLPLIAYLALCLGSYDPADPGWSHDAGDAPVRNLGGAIGAWVASTLLVFLGIAAWLIPLVLGGGRVAPAARRPRAGPGDRTAACA